MITKKKAENGFTLVELAIVLVVIGLLIGGILKGQELILNAQITRTIADVRAVDVGISTFRSAFGAMPGDLRSARSKLPGCDNSSFCLDGNSDGVVNIANGRGDPQWNRPLPYPRWSESYQFWKHLALADMIGGVDPLADPDNPEWGGTHPGSPLGGGFEFYHDTWIGVRGGGSGNLLRMSYSGLVDAFGDDSGVVSPRVAARLDRKMDDGGPATGSVMANYEAISGDRCKRSANAYDEQSDLQSCTLFFFVLGEAN